MAERGIYRNMATQPDRQLAEKPLAQPLDADERRRLEALQERWYWFRRGLEMGIPSFFSTDAIYGQWPESCADFPWLTVLIGERGGFQPLDVLRMATDIPAQAIGLGGEVGRLAPGSLAGLLIISGNPLGSLRNLLRVAAVFVGGKRAL